MLIISNVQMYQMWMWELLWNRCGCSNRAISYQFHQQRFPTFRGLYPKDPQRGFPDGGRTSWNLLADDSGEIHASSISLYKGCLHVSLSESEYVFELS